MSGLDQDMVDWGDEPEIMNNLDDGSPPMFNRNNRYSNAYGDYRGGYGPGGGFGPPRFFHNGPFGRPPALFAFGRGFGPDGPPNKKRYMDDKAIRYLIRCGVAKDNLKNLPRELLNLIHPEHCGICAHHFESYTISRTHYISKNHLKNQKKFLVQCAEGFSGMNARESPLKSRNLYCELCDVQITSKVHADSHYSGKIHQAVVDGRKNPKNPSLLQPGMEGRIDQLIRREKSLRKQAKAEKKETDQDSKDAKAIPSELFCDICNTSVTCTEQMTMHLNGKRHLAKEKQHILRMMRGGGGNGKNNVEANSTAVSETVDDAVDESETTDTANGSQVQDLGSEDQTPLDSQVEEWSKGAGETWDDGPGAEEQ